MHAATPGSLRSRYYSEEEKAALASGDLQVGNLQPQIEALTVRLQRLLKAEAMSDEEALVVVERITREGGSLAGRETKYARRDFTGEVLRVMNTLERLVRTQAELDRARQMHLEDGPVTEICVRVIGGTADAIDGIAARQD